MKRTTFTRMVAHLLEYADIQGYDVLLDWALRDKETQKRMYEKGLSKCDGEVKRSQHQKGLAVDIYIIVDGKISNDKEGYEKLHEYWESVGGDPMIQWDLGHFQVH